MGVSLKFRIAASLVKLGNCAQLGWNALCLRVSYPVDHTIGLGVGLYLLKPGKFMRVSLPLLKDGGNALPLFLARAVIGRAQF